MTAAAPWLLIDFDSTLVTVETLERLAEITLGAGPDGAALRAEVAAVTDAAMAGELDFGQALSRRLDLLKPTREQVAEVARDLLDRISPSFARNADFLKRHAERIWIVSGGFRETILPVALRLGLNPDQVLANDLVYDAEGRAVAVDGANPLSRAGGKVEAVQALGLTGEAVAIGDGYTDYELKAAGVAARFHAYVETVRRDRVAALADRVAPDFDAVLHAEGLQGRYSFPRSRMKVLLLENVHPEAVRRFREAGYEVETRKGALDEDELIQALKGVSVLGLRSKTRLSARALEAADRLLCVGAFCIGTNQIDLEAAADRGVAVFNAPYSNTRSVVEMALGLIVTLQRGLFDKSLATHQGRWLKSAEGAREIRGKTLGLVGYGAIGSQLSVLAEALGMRVVYHDLVEKLSLGNARRAPSLNALLAEADVVSLHVDGRAQNTNLIGPGELARMKPGAFLLNLSRGHVVDVDALAEAVRSGRIGGAAVDVFPEEPAGAGDPFVSPLQGLPNVILTPHVGGSTEEAQEAIAEFAAERLLGFLNRGDTAFSVNLPNVSLSEVSGGHRLLHAHRNQPGVLAALNSVLASAGMNVLAQHLKTDERTGYVVVDVDRAYDPAALEALKRVPGTTRFRVLY